MRLREKKWNLLQPSLSVSLLTFAVIAGNTDRVTPNVMTIVRAITQICRKKKRMSANHFCVRTFMIMHFRGQQKKPTWSWFCDSQYRGFSWWSQWHKFPRLLFKQLTVWKGCCPWRVLRPFKVFPAQQHPATQLCKELDIAPFTWMGQRCRALHNWWPGVLRYRGKPRTPALHLLHSHDQWKSQRLDPH